MLIFYFMCRKDKFSIKDFQRLCLFLQNNTTLRFSSLVSSLSLSSALLCLSEGRRHQSSQQKCHFCFPFVFVFIHTHVHLRILEFCVSEIRTVPTDHKRVKKIETYVVLFYNADNLEWAIAINLVVFWGRYFCLNESSSVILYTPSQPFKYVSCTSPKEVTAWVIKNRFKWWYPCDHRTS